MQCFRGSRLRRLRLFLFVGTLIYLLWPAEDTATVVVTPSSRRAVDGASSPGPPETAITAASFVWVLLGDTHFQAYTLESIRQASLMNPGAPLWLVCERAWLNESHAWSPRLAELGVRRVFYDDLADDFSRRYDAAFTALWAGRSGMMLPTLNHRTNMDFTRVTMVRLAALARLLHVHALQRVVHVENDQMVYGSIAALADAADACGLRLGMTRVGARYAPAVVYARDAAALQRMLDFIYEAMAAGPAEANRVGMGYPTDMSMTATFFEAAASGDEAGAFAELPPLPDGSCVAARGGQFYDALPLGCYCCGDFYYPKKHLFVRLEESSVRYWDAPFSWDVSTGRRIPLWNGSRVFNLHMHNKQLHLFRSDELAIDPDAWAAVPERNR